MKKLLLYAVLSLAAGWFPAARPADISRAIVIVAQPGLRDALFQSTVIVVTPIGDDQHAGFIVNRPSSFTLASAFPAQASPSVSSPIYVGGPVIPEVLFALVPHETSPGGGSVRLMPGLYVAHEEAVIDGLIAARPEATRFVFGLVAWRPGELQREIDQGAWYVMAAEAAIVARDPQGLWEELLHRLQTPNSYVRVTGPRK